MKCQNLSDIELEKNSVNHKLASVTHEKEFIQVTYLPTMDCSLWYTGMDNPWLTFYKYFWYLIVNLRVAAGIVLK